MRALPPTQHQPDRIGQGEVRVRVSLVRVRVSLVRVRLGPPHTTPT